MRKKRRNDVGTDKQSNSGRLRHTQHTQLERERETDRQTDRQND